MGSSYAGSGERGNIICSRKHILLTPTCLRLIYLHIIFTYMYFVLIYNLWAPLTLSSDSPRWSYTLRLSAFKVIMKGQLPLSLLREIPIEAGPWGENPGPGVNKKRRKIITGRYGNLLYFINFLPTFVFNFCNFIIFYCFAKSGSGSNAPPPFSTLLHWVLLLTWFHSFCPLSGFFYLFIFLIISSIEFIRPCILCCFGLEGWWRLLYIYHPDRKVVLFDLPALSIHPSDRTLNTDAKKEGHLSITRIIVL